MMPERHSTGMSAQVVSRQSLQLALARDGTGKDAGYHIELAGPELKHGPAGTI